MGLGSWYRRRFIGRVKALRTLVKILELFRGEIRYGKAAMPECCKNMAIRLEEPYRESLQNVYRIYSEYQVYGGACGERFTFRDVFCAEMEQCFADLPLKPEDKTAFLEPFQGRGFQDGEMQMKYLEQGIEQLRDLIGIAERELPGKCRLALSLGGMCGLLMVIVLL
ncbi:MAG: stage III sporulation protein AB [Lachnospiraceae bacterium]|nr:stage III sporulation protein AB [Lachnospiraceae bacterium]